MLEVAFNTAIFIIAFFFGSFLATLYRKYRQKK